MNDTKRDETRRDEIRCMNDCTNDTIRDKRWHSIFFSLLMFYPHHRERLSYSFPLCFYEF